MLHTGKPGRPRKVIDPEFLREAFQPNRRISVTRLAETLHLHRNTVSTNLKANGISTKFSDISAEDIDDLIRGYRLMRPDSGLRYVMGYLRVLMLRVQRRRIIESIRRVDRMEPDLRNRPAIARRKYKVPRPNSLWHCDGHHKLIRWGIVIHGFIDGFCRTVSLVTIQYNCEKVPNYPPPGRLLVCRPPGPIRRRP